MAGKIIADTIETGAGADISTSYVVNGSAKLWTSFANTSGTPSALQSLNQSSITDSGVGHYGINTTNAFTNNEYSAQTTSSAEDHFGGVAVVDLGNMTASQLRFYTCDNNASSVSDFDRNNAQAHGDLA